MIITFKSQVPATQKLHPRPVIKSSTFTSTTCEFSRHIYGPLVSKTPENHVFSTGLCLLGTCTQTLGSTTHNAAGTKSFLLAWMVQGFSSLVHRILFS